ncbi:MAG: LytR C-terminal domain-containing protein [Actinomycetota bacterium]|nr:LytR C-terminal domain-containing protein [Actinomycetota bacterium]MDA2980430.1 LytR C-terminal domain-containing protein [Actinomycetota bacterium]
MAQSGKPSFLPDRFDDVDRDLGYVGTHRRQRSSWSVFAPVGIGLGAVVVLTLAGIWFVDRSDDYLTLDASEVPVITGEAPEEDAAEEPVIIEPEVVEEVVAVSDPTQIDTEGLTLTVLNGTATQGMAARAVERLVAIGWPEATATNADSTDIQQSVVAYSEDADKAIALGIAQELDLDADSVVQTTAYPGARVTVVLGADYVDTEST